MNQDSSIKKQKLPNQHLLKSFYSKQKSKSQNSPNANRSISKEQIKHQIKKVVYNYLQLIEIIQNSQKIILYHILRAKEKIQEQASPLKIIFTKKNKLRGKQKPQKQVKQKENSYLLVLDDMVTIVNTQPDLKQIFDRKKQQESKQKVNSLQKRNNYVVSQGKYQDQQTIKVNQRNKEESGFNIKAYLTPDQYAKFGERFPENFKRVGLLGRGGFSVVWLGVHRTTKKKVAVKQILTKNPHQTHLKQIWFGSYFFQKGGEARQQFENHIGINNICRLYSHQIQTMDSWLYYELCDESLGSSLFDLKGESINGQRFYRIQYKQLIYRIKENQNELKTLIVQVSKALFLINSHNIVHSDLKPENILLSLRKPEDKQGKYIQGVKLIDFGSSFLFTNLKQFSMATPQYMPPQILNYILFQNKLEYDEQMLKKMEKYKNPWIIDIWSLGCIILEIISGVPLWMSIQTRIQQQNTFKVTGLFAVKNRVFSKIIKKQIDVINNLDYHLDNHNYSGIIVKEDIRRILKRMLDLDPSQRISPIQILNRFGVACQPLKIPSY